MKPGPKPTPSVQNELAGNPGKRKRNRNEPKPAASDEAPPTWLRGDPSAIAVWNEFAPEMIRLGLLTKVDRLLFASLCERVSVYRRAARKLRRDLTQESGPNGRVKRPETEIAKGAIDTIRALAAGFGMSPADRARLEIAPPPPPNEGRGGGSEAAKAPQQGGRRAAVSSIAELEERRARRAAPAGQPG